MTPCIEWEGAKSSAGYGQRRLNGKTVYVHRLAYQEVHGEIPKGLVIRHKCDNPSCYNVDHLIVGTQRQNMQDCSSRGRVNKTIKATGEAQGLSKLTEATVKLIRESTLSGDRLAKELGVAKSTVNRVRSGKTWRNI
ncbi:HNH homing endonuclease [Klebsiella phage 117]|uniref:HNH homing endonuclease n=1 Tax=Klebsiella phage 117 TaxID=2601666 RepID=A0A5Q2W675_9CAUD|nr:HNH homing endonuclease [Klebsiella phage 117]